MDSNVSVGAAVLLLCTDCDAVTAFLTVPDDDGADRGERMCTACGQARWLPPLVGVDAPRASAAA